MDKYTLERFIYKAKKRHKNKYTYSEARYVNANTKLRIKCEKHGIFYQSPSKHLMGRGCPECANDVRRNRLLKSQDDYIKQAISVHKDKYDYSKVDYKGSEVPVIIICKKHGEFEQLPGRHLFSTGCPKCAIESRSDKSRLTTEEFIRRSKKVHGDTYDYTNTVYLNSDSPVMIMCRIHGEFLQYPKNHMNGSKCVKCQSEKNGIEQRISKDDFIKNSRRVHGNQYDYSEVRYTGNKIPVTIICKKHGRFTQRPDQHIHSKAGCPVCRKSKGERRIRNFLISNKIEYKMEYILPSDKKYRYDFFLPKLNILIEYDGAQHFRPVESWGGINELNEIQKRDREKNELARMYGIGLIRIPYTKLNSLEEYLLYRLSKFYRYRVKNKFYRNFLELCKNEGLDSNTRPRDVKHMLLLNNSM